MDTQELARWLRLAGALRRLGGYVEAFEQPEANLTRLGLATAIDRYWEEVLDLAEPSGIEEEFLRLFTRREDVHVLGQFVALTGWVEGQIDALTIEARIAAEAEAMADRRAPPFLRVP